MLVPIRIRRSFVYIVLFVLAAIVGWPHPPAFADPPDILRDYRFITDKSTVEVTGGIDGIDWPLNILGRFGLVTGYDYSTGGPTAHVPTLVPFTQFMDVKAILFDPRRASPLPLPGWDLDETLNLSGLSGTFTVPSELDFSGVEDQGQPIHLEATLSAGLLHLTGTNDPGCCDLYNYKVDAYAHLLPYADFNSDGLVDDQDFGVWKSNFGSTTILDADGNGDGIVDAADYTIWRDNFGTVVGAGGGAAEITATVSEPASLLLGSITALLCIVFGKGRFQRSRSRTRERVS